MRGLGIFVCLFAAASPATFPEEDWRDAVRRSMDLELLGQYVEARAVLTGALEAARRHPQEAERAGVVLWRLGWVCYVLGDYDEAGLRYRASLAQVEKAFGPEHPTLATVMSGYASVLEARREFRDAERVRRTALGIVERAVGPADPKAAGLRIDLANGYRARRDYARAEAAFREILAERHGGGKDDDAKLGQVWSSLGYVLLDTKRSSEAEEAFERSLSITSGVAIPEHPIHIDARYGLALAQIENGRRAEANRSLEALQSAALHSLGTSHPLSLRIMETRGAVLRVLGRRTEAKKVEETMRAARREAAKSVYSVSYTGSARGR